MSINRREEILNMSLSASSKLIKLFPDKEQDINRLYDIMMDNYLNDKGNDTLKWQETIGIEPLVMLQRSGWITMSMKNNFGSFQLNEKKLLNYVSKEELLNVKRLYKTGIKMLPMCGSNNNDLVKIRNKTRKTGLIREGLAKVGKFTFQFDTSVMRKYHKEISKEIWGKINSGNKDITYESICQKILSLCEMPNRNWSIGNLLIDPRGRAIHECTMKAINPISHKCIRALVRTTPMALTDSGFDAVYWAVAELHGYRGKNASDKIRKGKKWYESHHMPKKIELHDKIMLERIYAANPARWDIPIELDEQNSGSQFIGLLINSHELMNYTNVIGKEFHDVYQLTKEEDPTGKISRNHMKKIIVPTQFGYGGSIKSIWDNNNLQYDNDMIYHAIKVLSNGRGKAIKAFRDFIIKNAKAAEMFNVTIGDDTYEYHCNKFKWLGIEKEAKYVWTDKGIKAVVRNVKQVPDIERFKISLVSNIIHNLDSQVANRLCMKFVEKNEFVIPIHDSFIHHPNSSAWLREEFRKEIFSIYKNRKAIRDGYFKSIGIEVPFDDIDSQELSFDDFTGYSMK